MDVIKVIYHVACSAADIQRQAREIALEQTVEVPESLVTDPLIQEQVVGKVVEIKPLSVGLFSVTMDYNSALANRQLPQLLNLIYGNISIKNNIRLVDLILSESFVKNFVGPRYSLHGLRKLTGVYDRPLVATALKPRGSSPAHLAGICKAFALGGGDIIKDDHNLVDDSLDDFTHRIRLAQSAIDEANEHTGRNTLYFANVSAPFDQIERLAEILSLAGVRGMMLAPGLVGLDAARWLTQRHDLAVMSHPTATGTFFQDPRHGMEPSVMLGMLYRLSGVDISVFPNSGGRFGFTPEQCSEINQRLRAPWGTIAPAVSAPAGGMNFDTIAQMAIHYGADSVFLCGGALLSHSANLEDSTRLMLRKVQEHFSEKLETPERQWSPRQPSAASQKVDVAMFKFEQETWSWSQRPRIDYKGEKRIPFKDISRVELFGKYGEQADFELRYFEIQPGGFSSCEKHFHVHCVIGARGEGQLQINDQHSTLKPFDVAHIPPLGVHQLQNKSQHPFGFFCIVDRKRDRPVKGYS